ncbi:MAG TPA: threonine--tRNA ligase [Fervidicoccus fontis]|uniref:Threonine--tRNA ligase n=1 Tax=Fervidicoccus fontis TaxID=683846 RepID=A0A7C2YZ80_9CREN|nr:threonine--tRNA ligase [Fervidicoccus fontis]
MRWLEQSLAQNPKRRKSSRGSVLVSLVDGSETKEVSPGFKVDLKLDNNLGSSVFLLVITGEKKRKVVRIPARISGEWEKAEILYFFTKKGSEIFLDTVAHVIEVAIKRLFSSAKLAGFSLKDGEVRVDFYLEDKDFSREDAEKVVSIAKEIAKKERIEVIEANAEEELRKRGEDLLASLSKTMSSPKLLSIGGILTICDSDLHPEVLGEIEEMRLANLSVSHWQGREDSLLLNSIHVAAFPTKHDKKIFDERREEAEKRDHVKLGKEMDIFLTSSLTGAGLILWAPNGAAMRRALDEYIVKLHQKRGYQLVATPHIATTDLFQISGHLSHYRQNMFLFTLDEKEHAIKPMNCPFHILILKRKKWSYKELPVRYFEMGNVYRYERAGTLHGLTRVRGFVIDDAHIFVREDQIEQEISQILSLIQEIYSAMGLREYRFTLSLRDPSDKKSYMGSDEIWEHAESSLEKALENMGLTFTKSIGDAAFYGPKIDVIFRDSLGREWQAATIQLDFNLPERFDLTYMDKDNSEKRMVIIHRAILGSMERFIGLMLEQYAGRVPFWLAPIQVAVLPVEESSEVQVKKSKEIYETLVAEGVRTMLFTEGRLNSRLREVRMLRIPLVAVLGEKEIKSGGVSAKYITYGEDDRHRFSPKEEELEFPSFEEMLKWIKSTISKQTNGIL